MNYNLFTFFKDIKDRNSFIIKDNFLFLARNNDLIKYNIFDKKEYILVKESVYYFILLEGQLIFQLKNGGDLYLLDKEIIKGKFYLNNAIIKKNKLLIDRKNSDTKRYETVLLDKNGLISELNITYFPQKVINNIYVYIALNSLFVYRFNNELIWQHSFSDLLIGENIEKVGEIIVDKNILYLCLKDNKNRENNATFAIDAMTGNILNIYKGFYGRLQLQNDVLYEAFYYHVNKLDLQLGVIIKYDFEETLKPLNLIINYEKSIIDGDKLYFVSGLIATNRIAILDLTKKKIIWETILEIEDSNSFIVEMRLAEDKLYVSCSDHTLYIFEKEK